MGEGVSEEIQFTTILERRTSRKREEQVLKPRSGREFELLDDQKTSCCG